ncbi:Spore germination protein YaaH [Acetitomaculum ruminis DSM 5522]|uniref:Spore germination protein YaaH n=1 Tax=Acetitomaculum ruminis DSM 5522 TaxID=1120918 RepID=A0A1I0YSB0_9FIRM|nr:glycosyl hydrolase family 18 protein [Acetitomaculum ruminis]SFB16092.1 Spore germination protein YaaH [Acetitomaculum ruminis DSM 5522]
MKKKRLTMVLILSIIAIVLIFVLVKLVSHFSPGKDRMDLRTYFNISEDDQVGIVIQDSKLDTTGLIRNGQIYIDYDTVREELNTGFYWDTKENLLLYALPQSLVSVQADESDYNEAKEKKEVPYKIFFVNNDKAYIALDFIKEFTNIKYDLYENPYHVQIINKWGQSSVATLKKNDSIRLKAGIKSEILTDVNANDKVTFLDDLDKDWACVRSADGFIGYIKKKSLNEFTDEVITNEDFVEPEYTNIQKNYKLNIAWNQIFNSTANSYIQRLVAGTKGLNTVIPSWFRTVDTEGNISSLADSSYVSYCHNNNIEVWGMVTNVDNPDVDMTLLLSVTSSRQQLINKIMAQAIEYNLDGINVDIESLSADAGRGYIEFIRELSIKCRQNGLVLSVCDYTPFDFNSFYDVKSQAEVADYIMLMAYDEHYSVENPGSVASVSFVETGINAMINDNCVPSNKLVLGLPFYTRNWCYTPKEGGGISQSAELNKEDYDISVETVSMKESLSLVSENNANVVWEESCGQNKARYSLNGSVYEMWLEDANSIEEKMKRVKSNSLAGVSVWKLGNENEDIWDVITKYLKE